MLSEEENAIKKLNEILKKWQEIVNIEDKTEREIEMSLYMEDMPFEEIKTVLNLITKLQKENEYWKNGFERELEDNRKNTCELLKQDLILREKDKQIDLMGEYISKYDTDEDICEEQAPLGCDEINREVDCKECIKQYFEKLAKEKKERARD